METILIWLGSGFAFAIGVCVGAWCSRRINGNEAERKVNDLLKERNEIGWEQVKSLDRIAEVIERKGESI